MSLYTDVPPEGAKQKIWGRLAPYNGTTSPTTYDYYQKAVPYIEQSGSKKQIAALYHNLAYYHKNKANYKIIKQKTREIPRFCFTLKLL